MGTIVLAAARQFLGSPYRAGTLEVEGPERLVLNLREFDCVTLVESTLAIARCIAGERSTAECVRAELTRIRYRGGVTDGYASRLHYFSDWINDNERKGVVKDVTLELGGIPRRTMINFMSAHPRAYPRLRDPAIREAFRVKERALSAQRRAMIPVRLFSDAARGICDGDIIGIGASTPGLDIIHTGIAAHVHGMVHFLHAPLSGGVVNMSRQSLLEMLQAGHPQTGLVVARPLSP
jgi:hypothetical protein